MTTILLASHHRMASGLKDTLNYIFPSDLNILDISAYLSNPPVEEELAAAIDPIDPDSQILIFTDMVGGSVCQACAPYIIKRPNTHVIAGMNLPLVLTLALQAKSGNLTEAGIAQAIEEARSQIVYVNASLAGGDDEDEEDE